MRRAGKDGRWAGRAETCRAGASGAGPRGAAQRSGSARRARGAIAAALAGLLAAAAPVAADLGEDLVDPVDHPKVLDVAPELENGIDLGYVLDRRNPVSGLGRAGVVVGDVDQKEADVRGGFLEARADGLVAIGFQLGEPTSIRRKASKLSVSQSAYLGIWLNVTRLDPALSETVTARVRKCGASVTFKDRDGTYSDENLPDFATWKLSCDKGWLAEVTDLSPEARAAAEDALGKGRLRWRGKGAGVDLDVVLADFDIPILSSP